jgi:putative IMPACT (imprinted ancient) family translation regulator
VGYRTVKDTAGPVTCRIKGSRFIAYLYPCHAGGPEIIITRLGKHYHDSTHICYAYRFRESPGNSSTFRYHDDGEPTHTAGLPIYRELERANLFNVLLTVIRYFGGTKLGCGGLTRAYRDSARAVIAQAKILTVIPSVSFVLEVPFELIGQVMGLIKKYNFTLSERQHFNDGTRLTISVKISDQGKAKRLFSGLGVTVSKL